MLGDGQLSVSAYVISNHLTLWNDFTHFFIDPVNGDQEAQHEDRATFGTDVSFVHSADFAGIDNELLIGMHVRDDFIDVSRVPTKDRVLLIASQDPLNFSETDQVRLGSVAGYVQTTTHWSQRFRSVLGLREDYMQGSDTGTNSGSSNQSLAQPKISLIYAPASTSEFYLSAGRGFHSDDLRGVDRAVITGISGAPLIASQTGEELGLRQQFSRNVALTLALYSLDAQSETTYDPDVGQDTAGPASRREGFEVNMTYQVRRWLEFYDSYSADHSRFKTPYNDSALLG